MLDEAEEKRRKGMWVFVRAGLGQQEPGRPDPDGAAAAAPTHVALCTDDREPDLSSTTAT